MPSPAPLGVILFTPVTLSSVTGVFSKSNPQILNFGVVPAKWRFSFWLSFKATNSCYQLQKKTSHPSWLSFPRFRGRSALWLEPEDASLLLFAQHLSGRKLSDTPISPQKTASPFFQGSGSFWKTTQNPGKTAIGFRKERWLKRMPLNKSILQELPRCRAFWGVCLTSDSRKLP